MIKTIRHTAIESIPAHAVEAGMLLHDGVVLAVRRGEFGYYFDTPHATITARPNDYLNVYARLDREATQILVEEFSKDRTGRSV